MATPVGISIPDGLAFADLHMARDPATGDVIFDWAPIEKICAASGLDIALFRDSHEDNVGGLIVAWYAHARAQGEPIDPVQEQILAEVVAEDALGAYRVQRGPATPQ